MKLSSEEENLYRAIQTKIRRKRFTLFKKCIASLPRPLHILDVGGTQEFWKKMAFTDHEITITLYNLEHCETEHANTIAMIGDARDMHMFRDREFDIVFSNSVIEHVGTYNQQRKMAQEVQRVGRRYYVQTPNRYFFIEPHVLLPLFQFLPFGVQVFILAHFRTPWGWKLASKQEAVEYISGIRLLTEKELRDLFPGATIYKEKFLGMTKSFIAWGNC